jgi:hypothetical protein
MYGCVPVPLAVDTSLPAARVGDRYEHRFQVTGGVKPYTFDLVGLPAGLAFDSATGTITGTPLTARQGVSLELTVTDSSTPAERAVETMTLVVKTEAVRITTDEMPAGVAGEAYTKTLGAEGGLEPMSWAVTSGVLPDGLRLNLSNGAISGTPAEAGSWTFEVTVTDSDDPATTDTASLTIEVAE